MVKFPIQSHFESPSSYLILMKPSFSIVDENPQAFEHPLQEVTALGMQVEE